MGHAGVGCARWSGACARVVGVVLAEQNAREYLHEDDDGEGARYAQNLPDRHDGGAIRKEGGLGDGCGERFPAGARCWRSKRAYDGRAFRRDGLICRNPMLSDTQTLDVFGSVAPRACGVVGLLSTTPLFMRLRNVK